MPAHTRRHLLIRVIPSLALAALFPACGQPATVPTATPIRSRAVPPVGAATPATLSPVVGVSPSSVPRSPVAATPTPPTPTPTLSTSRPIFLGRDYCGSATYRSERQNSDPYAEYFASQGAAIAFTEKVRGAELVILGMVRDILPSRWATQDGRRPENPHIINRVLIVTPVRVAVERVAKGAYGLPDIYFAVPGGRIGQECAGYNGSGALPEFNFAGRYLYFVSQSSFPGTPPVPGDDRYRDYRADFSYTVLPDNTITLGPARDIMGNRADDPPRTLTVDEALREIAALTGLPAATPTR